MARNTLFLIYHFYFKKRRLKVLNYLLNIVNKRFLSCCLPAFIHGLVNVTQYLQVLANGDNMQGGEGDMKT